MSLSPGHAPRWRRRVGRGEERTDGAEAKIEASIMRAAARSIRCTATATGLGRVRMAI